MDRQGVGRQGSGFSPSVQDSGGDWARVGCPGRAGGAHPLYVAEVPALPDSISQGDTREEALANIREAIALYLESLEEHQEPMPPSIHEEIVEV